MTVNGSLKVKLDVCELNQRSSMFCILLSWLASLYKSEYENDELVGNEPCWMENREKGEHVACLACIITRLLVCPVEHNYVDLEVTVKMFDMVLLYSNALDRHFGLLLKIFVKGL